MIIVLLTYACMGVIVGLIFASSGNVEVSIYGKPARFPRTVAFLFVGALWPVAVISNFTSGHKVMKFAASMIGAALGIALLWFGVWGAYLAIVVTSTFETLAGGSGMF